MKKVSVLVRQMLMSTLTLGLFAMAFAACSDEDVLNEPSDLKVEQTVDGEPLKAVGLIFNDFINLDDVQILNDDTTQISISKAFAEKKGLDNFVNRPMGIWLTFREHSFLRRGVSQRLEGDRYIVDVVDASIEEVLQPGCKVHMKTDFFLNTAVAEQEKTRSGEALEGSQLMESLFTDDEGYVHPVAISFPDASVTRGGMRSDVNYSPVELLGMMNDGGEQTRSSFWGGLWKGVKRAVLGTIDPFGVNEKFIDFVTGDDDETEGNYKGKLINYTGTQTVTKKFKAGEGKNDTITIRGKLPVKFQVNYVLDLEVGGTLTSPSMGYLRAAIDGEFKASPELTVGFARPVEIPKDLQKIKIHSFEGASVNFVVYGIPINITFKPSLYFKLKAKAEGSLYTGIKYEFDSKFVAGAEYSNSQWHDLSKIEPIKNDFSFIPPTAEFKFNGGIGVMLGCDIFFEKVLGPSIAAGPQLTLNLGLKVAPTAKTPITFSGDSKFGFMGEVGAKMTIWKWKVFDYFHDIDFGLSRTLWEYKYPDASNRKDDPVTIALDTATDLINGIKEQMR